MTKPDHQQVSPFWVCVLDLQKNRIKRLEITNFMVLLSVLLFLVEFTFYGHLLSLHLSPAVSFYKHSHHSKIIVCVPHARFLLFPSAKDVFRFSFQLFAEIEITRTNSWQAAAFKKKKHCSRLFILFLDSTGNVHSVPWAGRHRNSLLESHWYTINGEMEKRLRDNCYAFVREITMAGWFGFPLRCFRLQD